MVDFLKLILLKKKVNLNFNRYKFFLKIIQQKILYKKDK